MSEHALARVESGGQLSIEQVVGRMEAIQGLMRSAMVDGLDYGKIPGTGGKPTLLKPGAEKLCVMFQLDPQYQTAETWHDDGHLTVKSYCTVYHAVTQARLGGATAVCSTRESKYAYRRAERVCPACGKAAIIKGNAQYGGGWLCWKKKDGCGAKFADDAADIVRQQVGRVPNPDLADAYNTVIRLAEKRALVAAVRQVTGASAIFDEDVPDREPAPEPDPEPARHDPKRTPRPAATDKTLPEAMAAELPDRGDAYEPPAKAPPKSAVKLPANGAELFKRLEEYEARLEHDGVCARGELLAHVIEAGVKAGLGQDVGGWAAPGIALAAKETRAFEAKARGGAKLAAAQRAAG